MSVSAGGMIKLLSSCWPVAARSRWFACFEIEEYPKDLMSFYGQGYSISRFLIEIGGRPRFLHFVRDGLKSGWDSATFNHYGLADVRELDRAWRAWHRVSLTASVPDRDEGDLVSRDQPAGIEEQTPGR